MLHPPSHPRLFLPRPDACSRKGDDARVAGGELTWKFRTSLPALRSPGRQCVAPHRSPPLSPAAPALRTPPQRGKAGFSSDFRRALAWTVEEPSPSGEDLSPRHFEIENSLPFSGAPAYSPPSPGTRAPPAGQLLPLPTRVHLPCQRCWLLAALLSPRLFPATFLAWRPSLGMISPA